jgi:hypothetical protein
VRPAPLELPACTLAVPDLTVYDRCLTAGGAL